jgi:hypothetical protein
MLNNKENKMKKLSKLELVAKYLKANPKATTEDIMEKFKVARAYAYTLKSNAKKISFLPMTSTKITLDKVVPKERIAEVVHEISQGKTKPDMVNHPPHYKTGGIEVIDFIESKELGYHLGNVVKYISRAGLKDGNVIQDLKKAQWYLNRAIDFHNKYHGNES